MLWSMYRPRPRISAHKLHRLTSISLVTSEWAYRDFIFTLQHTNVTPSDFPTLLHSGPSWTVSARTVLSARSMHKTNLLTAKQHQNIPQCTCCPFVDTCLIACVLGCLIRRWDRLITWWNPTANGNHYCTIARRRGTPRGREPTTTNNQWIGRYICIPGKGIQQGCGHDRRLTFQGRSLMRTFIAKPGKNIAQDTDIIE